MIVALDSGRTHSFNLFIFDWQQNSMDIVRQSTSRGAPTVPKGLQVLNGCTKKTCQLACWWLEAQIQGIFWWNLRIENNNIREQLSIVRIKQIKKKSENTRILQDLAISYVLGTKVERDLINQSILQQLPTSLARCCGRQLGRPLGKAQKICVLLNLSRSTGQSTDAPCYCCFFWRSTAASLSFPCAGYACPVNRGQPVSCLRLCLVFYRALLSSIYALFFQ